MKCAKIQSNTMGMDLFIPLDDLKNGLEWAIGEKFSDHLNPGDQINIEVIEMTQEELDSLPEFDG